MNPEDRDGSMLAELGRSEAEFRQLVESLPQLVWITRPDGYHEYFNRRWYEYTGTAPGETSGELWTRVLHPDDCARTLQRWHRSLETGEPYEIEYRIRQAGSGSYRWFLGRALPLRDETGAIARWFGTCTDIHEQKEAQTALRESEERFRTLFANMTEGFILGEPILDEEGRLRDVRFVDVNKAFERETGLSREVVGRPFTEALPNLERSWIDYYGGVALTGEPIHFENYNKDTDRHYDVFCYSPSPGRFAAVFRDVTSIRKLAREQERTLAMLDSMLTYAPAGFAFFDREHRYVRINEFLCRINGLPAEAHLGRPIREVLPENAKTVDPLLDTLFETGRPMENIEVTGETPLHPGEVRHWLTGWYPVPLPEDQEPLVGGVVMEITEQKRMEQNLREAQERLREANELLERRVAERTAELERANRELDAFNYSISHDLRAPLRSIDGFSQALLEDYPDRLDERGRDYLNRVRAAAQRMADLIDDQLRLSRIGRAELRKVPVDLSALAREVAEELRLREPGRKVEWVIPPGLTARGDRALLKIALDNLLGNAWKFTSRTPGARIEIGRQEGKEPVFFVRDNGAGFDMAYADRLFAPYQRLHSQQEFAGTGIGTTLVQRIVQRHGGRVWAEGAVNEGATFWFTLPVGAKNAEAGTPV